MDRVLLADFLRARRQALQPEDVGLPRGSRRRTGGLRREEVAARAGMSSDYYSRIEQQRGPMPSEQMLTALAAALNLAPSEQEHLFDLGGYAPPRRVVRGDEASATMVRVVERLTDTPAMVFSPLGETLLQTPPAVSLFGNQTRFTGMARYLVYRWFTDPAQRSIYPHDDHELRGRVFASEIRAAYTANPRGRAGEIVAALLEASPGFGEIWQRHEVGVVHHHDLKRYLHSELGELEMYAQRLVDPDTAQELLIFSATPGSPSHEKLRLLPTVASQ
ncbi:helix-turn-helix transcriptional regulator [Streptomyces sp. NPDC048663]|uniref:helix-turn-helix transcriptional regulator n=1 Tax=Streptomyces sp. NPDC048663 TaxID=3155638 RepID=UPI003441C7BB